MKISEYEFSKDIRKDLALMDFIADVRNAINLGVAEVVTNVQNTGQTGDITTTIIFTPTTTGFFRVSVYMICTTAGGGTLSCTVGWTDEVGAKTISPSASVDLSSTSNGSTGEAFIKANVADITFSTAIAGKTGSPQYAIYIVLEQLG